MADTGRNYTQENFTGLRHGDINFDDLEGLLGFESYGGARLDHVLLQ